MRKTKIICTLGPSVDREDLLESLIMDGMDCARLNFSHGTHGEQKKRMDMLKSLRKKTGREIPILLDTKGPEIRVQQFENGWVELKKGDLFTFTPKDGYGNEKEVGLTYKSFAHHMKSGMKILADDGRIAFTVKEISGGNVVCTVENGGILKNRKSLNVPLCEIPMDFISEEDKKDILFGIEQDVDFVAASFVRDENDVKDMREFLDRNGGGKIGLLAKIENPSSLSHIDEIINSSDGIMIARGDLGVELELKKLPDIQKRLIEKCFLAGKHCITATQMLESMVSCPRPTRAEVSDIANAIYDGTTAIMLSGESASGAYPREALKMMAEVAEYTEKTIDYKHIMEGFDMTLVPDIPNTIAMSVCKSAHYIDAQAIVAVTRNGRTGELVACFRPACPIIAATVNEKAMRKLYLSWGVFPVPAVEQDTADELFGYAIESAKKTGLVKKDDLIIITGGNRIEKGFTSMMSIHKIR